MSGHHLVHLGLLSTPLLLSLAAFLLYWADFLHYILVEGDPRGPFDFIIVGGGTAGCVLANRLSQHPSWRVLLLEAGGAPSLLTSLPTLTPALQLSPYDWQTETVPQKHACKAMVGGRCRWPHGKMLGGSSGLNYMLHVRGQHQDYDHWAHLVGDSSWNYTSLLPHFSSSLSTLPLSSPHTSPLTTDYLEMAEALKNPTPTASSSSPSSPPPTFSTPVVHQEEGRRADTYRTYLRPVLHRSNLVVATHARVTSLGVEGDQVQVVRYTRYGRQVEVRADKEVILASGTVNSARLLLLSGIGPAGHLSSLGIPVVRDLPVGNNLQDHLTTTLGPFLLNSPVGFDPLSLLRPSTYVEYLVRGRGPLATVGVDFIAFLSSGLAPREGEGDSHKKQDKDIDDAEVEAEVEADKTGDAAGGSKASVWEGRPDYQLLFMSSWLAADYWTIVYRTFGLDTQAWEGYYKHLYSPSSLHAVSILPILLRPASRGTIRLSSSSPWAPPLVDPCYLCDPQDRDLLVTAIEQTVAMVSSSPALTRHGYSLPSLPWPGCEGEEVHSTQYWHCYIQQVSLTMYHPVGSCRMGRQGDPRAVVDPSLRVQGLSNLRVADASIMPTIVSANTQAATLAIAEKAASMVISTWLAKKEIVQELEGPINEEKVLQRTEL